MALRGGRGDLKGGHDRLQAAAMIKLGSISLSLSLSGGRSMVHNNADKMLRPSFGEPGQCFALSGSSGFVQIKLRTAIVPEAFTLEHVAKGGK